MRERNLCRRLGKLAALFTLFVGCAANDVQAGETSVYLKSGWFEWEERVRGDVFVKEEGFLHAAGISRRDELSRVTLTELLEVWGGVVDYDGHDVTGTLPIDSDTIYFGTREEFSAGLKFPVAKDFSVEPFAAAGHKFWIRTRSSEDWNLFYGKVGIGGDWTVGNRRIFARGGALIPLYTRNHVSLDDAGYEDVVVEPESKVTGFAEAGVRMGAVTVSVEYESVKFSQSDSVSTRRLSGGGAVLVDNQAFQPPSDSSTISLKVAYGF